MSRELDPVAVSARLRWLAARWEPEDAEAVRRRVAPPADERPFEERVAGRLEELRALLELTRHLHGRASR